MKKVLTLAVVLGSLMLAGCSTHFTDEHGDRYVKGVVYYDRNGTLQEPVPEYFSPETQDKIETFGWILTPILAVTGAATGIVALTN